MTGTVLFLVNGSSGRVRDEGPEAIERDLRAALPQGAEARFVVGGVPDLLDAITGGERAVVTVGGDGTIGAVAGKLAAMDEPPRFVPLPYGTANLIPRDFGFPMDPAAALSAAMQAPLRRVDYAEANGRPLLHSAVFGTFAEVAEAREELRDAKGPGEALAAAAEALGRLVAAETDRYHLEIDGEPLDAVTNVVFVTNNAITGGERGVPVRERLDAGELVVYVSDSKSPVGFVRRVIEAVTGGFDDSDGVIRHVCARATVGVAEGELHYSVDGEVIEGDREVAFTIRPGALAIPDLRG